MKKSLSNSRMETVEAQSLLVHPDAQRAIIPSKLKKLKAEMDLDAIGVLHAVEYSINGRRGIWIIDGQHRLRALMELGLGEWLVEVKVHLDAKDDKRASALFLKLNDRALVSPFAKFDNELKAGFPAAVEIVHILSQRGLKIGDSPHDGTLACPASLKRVYAYDDGESLELAIDIIIQSWGTRSAGLEGKMIEGMGLVCKTYTNEIDKPALIKKLSKYPGGASSLMGDAKGIQDYRKTTLNRCVAERIVDTYNKGRTKKLDPL